jgi:hypothetical protein
MGTGVQQCAKGIGGLDPLRTNPLVRPSAVVDGVVRLHRRNHSNPGNPSDILPSKMLGMLDSEAAVARAVSLRDAVIDIEQQPVRALADRMHRNLEARGIASCNPGPERILRGDHKSDRAWRVGVWLIEQRRGGAQGTIHEPFHTSRAKPIVAGAISAQRVGHCTPGLE